MAKFLGASNQWSCALCKSSGTLSLAGMLVMTCNNCGDVDTALSPNLLKGFISTDKPAEQQKAIKKQSSYHICPICKTKMIVNEHKIADGGYFLCECIQCGCKKSFL